MCGKYLLYTKENIINEATVWCGSETLIYVTEFMIVDFFFVFNGGPPETPDNCIRIRTVHDNTTHTPKT